MGDIYFFALTAALNPTLLTATTVMLLLDHPKRLLLGYLLGALLTSLTCGLVIIGCHYHHAGHAQPRGEPRLRGAPSNRRLRDPPGPCPPRR